MSELKDDGGSAFPFTMQSGTLGMSLRDWFAGQALAGCTIYYDAADIEEATRDAAVAAYRLADAMLAERERCK